MYIIQYRNLQNKENYTIMCQGEKEIRSGAKMTTYFLERPNIITQTVALPAPVPAAVLDNKMSNSSECVLM